jgi:hypothetical protein
MSPASKTADAPLYCEVTQSSHRCLASFSEDSRNVWLEVSVYLADLEIRGVNESHKPRAFRRMFL